MNLHEFQAKNILKSFNVQIQRGFVATNSDEAVQLAKQLTNETGTNYWVIKAQIHAGGRGKGGGIKLAKSLEDVRKSASKIIGMKLVTPQTSVNGKKVNQVLIAEDVYYTGSSSIQEFYISITLNRAIKKNMIIYSLKGGIDIEVVAKENPSYILVEEIDPKFGLQLFQARKIAFNFGLSGESFKQMVTFIINLYKAYIANDFSLLEINPILKTSDNKIIAVDAKVTIDDNALFRHKNLQIMRDFREEDSTEVEANNAGLNFVKLDGNVGCMVNGAGLAMATMDMIKFFGGSPANFLDVGGSADPIRVKKALEIILKDKNVKAILINIFGGIVRCDRVAKGLLDAYESLKQNLIQIPIIVRLQGTNFSIAKKMINESHLDVYYTSTLEEAGKQVEELLKIKK